MAGDIILAILSGDFIGNPASSFSQYIVIVRYALEFEHLCVYIRKNTVDGKWKKLCDDETCFYQLYYLDAHTHHGAAPDKI